LAPQGDGLQGLTTSGGRVIAATKYKISRQKYLKDKKFFIMQAIMGRSQLLQKNV
jgi:hypothetical protein